jgi:hypothetical protein
LDPRNVPSSPRIFRISNTPWPRARWRRFHTHDQFNLRRRRCRHWIRHSNRLHRAVFNLRRQNFRLRHLLRRLRWLFLRQRQAPQLTRLFLYSNYKLAALRTAIFHHSRKLFKTPLHEQHRFQRNRPLQPQASPAVGLVFHPRGLRLKHSAFVSLRSLNNNHYRRAYFRHSCA